MKTPVMTKIIVAIEEGWKSINGIKNNVYSDDSNATGLAFHCIHSSGC
jgi:hypothetical protein